VILSLGLFWIAVQYAATATAQSSMPATRHEHLAQADRLIADCLDRIPRQREVITTEYEQVLPNIAESMLRALEENLRAFEKQGDALAISVPAGETRVLKHFQERMP
jgi:hypothetical protein